MLDLIKTTFSEFMDDEAPRMAAALSYYAIFSLPPLLILVVLIASAFWSGSDVQGQLVQQIGGVLGSEGADQIRSMIEHANRPGSGGPLMTLLSIAALLFGATGAFAQLQAALNQAWDVKQDPEKSGIMNMVMKRVLSFGMILVVALLLLASMVVSWLLTAAGGAVAGALPGGLGSAALWLIDILLSLLVITGLFMAMYRVLPDAEVEWRDVWQGALVTAVLFVVGKFLLGFYIARSEPGSAYGAAGSLAVIMIWIYYSSMIFLLGAEFTQVYAQRKGSGIQPDEDAVRA